MTTTSNVSVERLLLKEDYIAALNPDRPIHERGQWPCKLVSIDPLPPEPFIAAYRCRFTLERPASFRLHLTADERYDLYLDGQLIGRGPERGDAMNWFYQSYQLTLDTGPHVLVAVVQRLGELAPLAQMSVKHGLIVAAENVDAAMLNTGHSPWEARLLTGLQLLCSPMTFGTGAYSHMTGSQMAWGIERGEGEGWTPVKTVMPILHSANDWRDWGFGTPMLRPSILPAMRETDRHIGRVRHIDAPALTADDTQNNRSAWHARLLDQRPLAPAPVLADNDLRSEHAAWDALLRDEQPLVIAPRTLRRVIIDLDDYYCAYPMLQVSGGAGADVYWQWAESLFTSIDEHQYPHPKHNRGEIENKVFHGISDWFEPDGAAHRLFTPHWWRSGRYLQIIVRTADAPLTLERIALRQTGYPLDDHSNFDCSDARYRDAWPVMVRAMQMCSHEHYMDCPYYEQLMYVGDSRLEALTHYCMTTDARLPRKAIETFGYSRFPGGLTQSRYPCRTSQIIAPFSLWWVGMVYDHALWRDDPTFIRRMLPGVRGVLDAYAMKLNDKNLLEPHNGWNFVDWVHGWQRGCPSHGETRPTATITLQFVLALLHTAEVELWLGESAMAQRWNQLARRVFDAAFAAFFDSERGLFAESDDHQLFTEHAQCLALLTNLLDTPHTHRVFDAWHHAKDLSPCSIYFTHYVFEMLRKMDRTDLLLERMKLWYDLPAQGFKTTVECPEPARSDCHAWGAHPIYHAFASILGIRPGGFGFKTVRIAPQLGPLDHAEGTLPHPLGDITVKLRRQERKLTGFVELPAGLSGTLLVDGRETPLPPGRTVL